jgi:uncharacterized SAM-binding protein YcdF (DUF218 family)
MGYFLKKLISAFLLPIPAAWVLLGVGLALLWFTRRQRAGKVAATAAFALIFIFGIRSVPNGLLAGLEERFEPLYPRERLVAATTGAGRRPKWIVVLGSGHTFDRRLPPAAQLSASALPRVVEGVRLYRELPGVKLVVSGAPGAPVKHAEVMAAAARAFGVPAEDIVVDVSAWDTADEARAMKARIGPDAFLLVTSASHMQRAVLLFRKVGLDPIAAPTDHLGLDRSGLVIGDFLPNAGALWESDRATHEYLGILWSKLRGQI